ncbi:MAG: tryptophan--tRNA ligase [Thermodesulfobacteriota bacterium]|nr:tryptophan--tRNA ligase [Thermodesulfobacteriota bacterium]
MTTKRVISGMRPSGKLHLGHLFGALDSWRTLQEEYSCLFFAADWHALTSEYEDTKKIKEDIIEMVTDWLCAGIDPEKSILFIQSRIPEHAELHLILSMITPLAWLTRNPTYKEQQQEITNKDLSTYGFLGYPVLQASDIIIYKSIKVPVGMDQLPHLELCREISRRFNFLYKEVFPIPEPILTEVPKLLGVDNRKMSKSYGNAIYISDSKNDVANKVGQMITDPQRARRSDPGDPTICNVFSFHNLFSPEEETEQVEKACPVAGIGCVECKKKMALYLNAYLEPFREKRAEILNHRKRLYEILDHGNKRAREIAISTMEEVREAIRI